MFESIKDELMVIDIRDFRVLAANNALLDNVRMEEKEIIGKQCYAVTHHRSTQCSPPDHSCPIAEMLRTGEPIIVEHTHFDSEGNPYYVEVSASPVTDKERNIVQAVHLARDITARKKAEETLVESERRYRSLFANMNSGFAFCKIVSDNDGKPIDYVILEVNDDFEKLTRLRKEAVLGKRVSEVFFSIEKDPADWIGIYGRVATTGEPARFESYFELLKKWFSVAAYRPEIGYFAMAFDDITERRKMEAELSNLAKFPSENPNVILRLSKDGKLLYSNPASKRLLGNWLENLNLSLPEHWRKNLTETLSSGKKLGFEEQIRESTFSFTFAPIVSEGYVNVYAEDITDRKKAEEVLLESEERLNRSQEIAHLGSWELDLTNNRLTWSDEAYRIFGLKPQEFGATYEAFLDAVHPEDRAAVDAAYSGSLREGRDTYEIEHRVVRKSTGEIRIVYEKCNHIRDGSGRIIRSVGMVHDITERKKAEQEIVETLGACHRRQAEVSALLEASKAVLVNREFSRAARSIFEFLQRPAWSDGRLRCPFEPG